MSSFPMAGRGPRARYYAGVNSLSIFSAQGSNPLQDCKVLGKGVTKIYDKSVKGYAYSISGGLQSKLQLPKDDSKMGLQLLHHFLVLQVFVPQGVHFSLELRVSDMNSTRRKMYFSTSFSDMKSTPLHCQIPISMVTRNKWLSLAFHVADLFNSSFGSGVNFRSIDFIVLGPVCKLRKIFTMRCRLAETARMGFLEEAREDCLPQEHRYAIGVDCCIQTVDMASLQTAAVSNNESHGDDSRLAVGPESALSARKGNQGKIENTRPVHVAFGTRMPLPLSTVQINTNLPHDKCPTLLKDRIGRVHFISDRAAAEAKELTAPSNMITRALNTISGDNFAQRRVDNGVFNCRAMKMADTGQTGCSVQYPEEISTTTMHDISGESEGAVGEPQILTAKVPLQNVPSLKPEITSMIGEDQFGVDTSNKSPSKWSTRKREVHTYTHIKQQRKDHRSKEEKDSRYMDSPPGSPPCGWDRCNGGNQSEDKRSHDHFLDRSWMNSQLSDSVDGGKPYCLANSLKEKILSSMPHCLPTRLDDDDEEMTDAMQRNVSKPSSDYYLHQSMSLLYGDNDQCGTVLKGPKSYMASGDSASPYLVKGDIGTPGYCCKDPEAITYDDYSERQSWSSGSSSVPRDVFCDFPHFLSHGPTDAAIEKLRGGAHLKSDPKDQLPTPLLTKEAEKGLAEEEIMFDLLDDRFFPSHSSEKRKDPSGLDTIAMLEDIFSTEARTVGDSLDFDSEADVRGELEFSPQDTPMKMSEFSNFRLDPVKGALECDILSEADQHPPSNFPISSIGETLAQQNEGGVKCNTKHDEDLDLLYDPTLDCYYDPKTNRYYELK